MTNRVTSAKKIVITAAKKAMYLRTLTAHLAFKNSSDKQSETA